MLHRNYQQEKLTGGARNVQFSLRTGGGLTNKEFVSRGPQKIDLTLLLTNELWIG